MRVAEREGDFLKPDMNRKWFHQVMRLFIKSIILY